MDELISKMPEVLKAMEEMESYKIDLKLEKKSETAKHEVDRDLRWALEDAFLRVLKRNLDITKEMLEKENIESEVADRIQTTSFQQVAGDAYKFHPKMTTGKNEDDLIEILKYYRTQKGARELAQIFLNRVNLYFYGGASVGTSDA